MHLSCLFKFLRSEPGGQEEMVKKNHSTKQKQNSAALLSTRCFSPHRGPQGPQGPTASCKVLISALLHGTGSEVLE